MSNNAKVTVIMSNYNQEDYIEQAIQSVLNQKVDFEYNLIITDDFSQNDNSVEIIKKYKNNYPGKITILLNKENGGYLKNILRAKTLTKTPYFCLLDADDFWTDNNYLQSAVNFLDKNPDFVIYSRNVICLYEDGSEKLFIDGSINHSDYDISDYFEHRISISQTTGSFFRNVIFINGIPDIMQHAVGTISERSFEGDFDRYLMHLKYGKAHYEPEPSGVYRISSNGIWSKLSKLEQDIINGQALFDYNSYFEDVYLNFFVNESYIYLKKILKEFSNIQVPFHVSSEYQEMFFNILNFCSRYDNVIFNTSQQNNKKLKLKYRILLFIYSKIKNKLIRKKIIDD